MTGRPPETRPVPAGRVLPDAIGDRHTFAHEQVLAYLACVCGDGSRAVLSKREIAHALGMGESTVGAALLKLRGCGLVESVPRLGPTGARLSNEYQLSRDGLLQACRLVLRAHGPSGR